jgi:hypothetical protein
VIPLVVLVVVWAVVLAVVGVALILEQQSVSPLDSLNANICYDLTNKLDLFFGTDDETNPYIANPLNSKFYDFLNTFSRSFHGDDKFLFLSLNIRNLMCNFDKFSSFISHLATKGVNIYAIALQEVWSVPYPELVAIDGFNLTLKYRKNSWGGGVLAFTSITK